MRISFCFSQVSSFYCFFASSIWQNFTIVEESLVTMHDRLRLGVDWAARFVESKIIKSVSKHFCVKFSLTAASSLIILGRSRKRGNEINFHPASYEFYCIQQLTCLICPPLWVSLLPFSYRKLPKPDRNFTAGFSQGGRFMRVTTTCSALSKDLELTDERSK